MKRISVESPIEGQITSLLVASTDFISKIQPVINLDYIESPHLRKICSWCIEYYTTYRKAPSDVIRTFYDLKLKEMSEAESDIIKTILIQITGLDSEKETNEAYIYDQALKYFNERDLSIRLDRATKLKEVGRTNDAWDVLNEKTNLSLAVSKWETVLTLKDVVGAYSDLNDSLFSMPGALGELIGGFKRGWLVGILGGFKRGKTNYMISMAVQAMMHRLKVAFVSLEMPAFAIKDRIYRNISGLGDESSYLYPIFDCMLNQLGTCSSPSRPKNPVVRRSATDLPIYNASLNYTPCTLCRKTDDAYEPAVWYEPIQSPILSVSNLKDKVQSFRLMYGNNIRVISRPRFSASIDDVRRDLDVLEHQHKFIPDVIIDDYADIHKPGSSMSSKEPRHIIDDAWKNLAGLAAERQAVVITGSQGNRGSLKKALQEEEDMAEWIGKLGHVDVFIALNQLPAEKRQGYIRFNILAHRYRKFFPDQEVMVLQQLDTGQPYLDSEFV